MNNFHIKIKYYILGAQFMNNFHITIKYYILGSQ